MNLLKFTSYYFVFTGLLIALAILVSKVFPSFDFLTRDFWIILTFIGGITYIAYVMAHVGIKRNAEVGVFAILGSIIIKLLFCMAFVLIYSMKVPDLGIIFILNFFSLYLLYTAFVICCLLRNLRHQN